MKVEATYWDNKTLIQPRRRTRVRVAKRNTQAMSKWFVFVVIAVLSLIVCLAVNIRAFSEWNAEVKQNQQLTNDINQLESQNALLQQQVFNLKNDPATIEREARKIKMGRPDEKIIVPTN
jgi:cell division protein FtsB